MKFVKISYENFLSTKYSLSLENSRNIMKLTDIKNNLDNSSGG